MAIGLIGVLLLCTPPIASFARLPTGESLSELYLLGPEHIADGYPHNVTQGIDYLIYLGVENHMGESMYYKALVKFRNASEPLPNIGERTPSSLPKLYSYNIFLKDGQVWEDSLVFSFANVTFGQNISSVSRINVNGVWTGIGKSTVFDNATSEYRYDLFVELWVYNVQNDTFVYHNRYTNLRFNMLPQGQ
jgi:hypothetical protein